MRITKWGNSLGVRLPKELVAQMNLRPGDELVIVNTAGKQIDVEKVDRRKHFLTSMETFHLPLPEDYKFDRDEANKR